MDILEMKQKDFKAMPITCNREEIPELFDSVVIIPEKHLHDSGWKCMSYVLCKGCEPIVRVAGGSDVIHIDGIGGYGEWEQDIPEMVKPKGWTIDCLPCGYLRLFSSSHNLKTSQIGFSDFDIYAVKE